MKYLDINALSEKLGGRSHSSLYRDVRCGRLPRPFKYGALNYWREQDIDDALKVQIDAAQNMQSGQNDA